MGAGESAVVRNVDKRTSRREHHASFEAAIERFRHAPFEQQLRGCLGSGAAKRLRVCVRKRPLFPHERKQSEFDVITGLDGRVLVHDARMHPNMTNMFMNHHDFTFDEVFNETVDDDTVYAGTTRELVQAACKGGRGTVMMYGQTGSGKTYTMSGLYERAARDIFALAGNRNVTVCFVELVGDACFDMLKAGSPCTLTTGSDGAVHPYPCAEVRVVDAAELLAIMRMALKLRATAATGVHDQSSRSHAVCRIFVEGEGGVGVDVEGCLTLVDLAGTEHRIDNAEHNAERAKEGAKINASLAALKDCIRATAAGAKFVSFRQNRLTQLLRDCFANSGFHATTVIATVSPSSKDTEHSLNTLRHACIMDGQGEGKAKQSAHLVGGSVTKEQLGAIDVTKIARERKLAGKSPRMPDRLAGELGRPPPAHQAKQSNTVRRDGLDRRCIQGLSAALQERVMEARSCFATERQRARLGHPAADTSPSAVHVSSNPVLPEPSDHHRESATVDATETAPSLTSTLLSPVSATVSPFDYIYKALTAPSTFTCTKREQPDDDSEPCMDTEARTHQLESSPHDQAEFIQSLLGSEPAVSQAKHSAHQPPVPAQTCADDPTYEQAMELFDLLCAGGRLSHAWTPSEMRVISELVVPQFFGVAVKIDWRNPEVALDELEFLIADTTRNSANDVCSGRARRPRGRQVTQQGVGHHMSSPILNGPSAPRQSPQNSPSPQHEKLTVISSRGITQQSLAVPRKEARPVEQADNFNARMVSASGLSHETHNSVLSFLSARDDGIDRYILQEDVERRQQEEQDAEDDSKKSKKQKEDELAFERRARSRVEEDAERRQQEEQDAEEDRKKTKKQKEHEQAFERSLQEAQEKKRAEEDFRRRQENAERRQQEEQDAEDDRKKSKQQKEHEQAFERSLQEAQDKKRAEEDFRRRQNASASPTSFPAASSPRSSLGGRLSVGGRLEAWVAPQPQCLVQEPPYDENFENFAPPLPPPRMPPPLPHQQSKSSASLHEAPQNERRIQDLQAQANTAEADVQSWISELREAVRRDERASAWR